jgi:transposase
LNAKPFKKLPGSRLSAFETLDQPALTPLPCQRYDYAEWKKVRVGIDYHVEWENHFYSVPHRLVGKEVELRITAHTLECFYKHERLASHMRSIERGKQTTVESHMPKAHRAHRQWTPPKLLQWATTIGPGMHHIVQHQLFESPHPELGYRACLGFLSLARKYDAIRLEAACHRAIKIGSLTRKSVNSILQAGLDQWKEDPKPDHDHPLMSIHTNIRGATYYH